MRPRRSDLPTEKVTVYLTPAGLADLKAGALEAGLSLGAYIEHPLNPGRITEPSAVTRTPPVVAKRKTPAADILRDPSTEHVPKLAGKFGTICARCGINQKDPAWQKPCPGQRRD